MPHPEPAIWAVIPAAGRGRRMGGETPKQYLPLAGRSVIDHTLACFTAHPRVTGIVVVIAADDTEWLRHELQTGKPVHVVEGGAERCHSVFNALRFLQVHMHMQANDWVLVHDAARPCLHPDDLTRLIETFQHDPVGGILAAPLADTLKCADTHGKITETVERAGLWRAFTPQMFRFGLLRAALEAALADGHPVTDEAAAMETAGHPVRVLEGRADNIKITTPADLELAAQILQARK